MRRKLILPVVAAALALGVAGASTANAEKSSTDGDKVNDCAARNSRGRHLQVVGLVADGTLVCFRDDRPGRAVTIGEVFGLVQDTAIVGIDYRPANNLLYGLGSAGGVYTIDPDTAEAKLATRLNKPLEGTFFGVDFNPTVDRLRIVSDTGQNLRTNVDDGTTTEDSDLNIPGPTPVNPALGVTAVGYTNNDADPNTATTLFDIDTTSDNTVIQAPPNAGLAQPDRQARRRRLGRVGRLRHLQPARRRHDVGPAPDWRRSPPLTVRPACTGSTCWPVGSPTSARSRSQSSISPSRRTSTDTLRPPTGTGVCRHRSADAADVATGFAQV